MSSLRLAIRALRGTPVVSATVVLTLALGIGANTAVFGVVNSLLLRALPVPAPDRLVTISSDFALGHGFKAGAGWNYEMWTRMQQMPPLFGRALAWSQPTFNLAQGGEKEPANGLLVSGGFFSTLGVEPGIGRLLTVEDDVKGGGRDGAVAVISDGLWRRRFGRSPGAIGSTLTLDGVVFTIVGVTPPEFLGIEVGQAFDVAIPLGAGSLIHGTRPTLEDRRNYTLAVIVRLKPGLSVAQATSMLRSIQPQVLGVTRDQLPKVSPAFLREPFVAVPAPAGTSDFSRLRTKYQRPLLTLLALVGLVLLVACVNVASILLARASARRHEIAVRLALGATRRQLLPQLLLESLVLSAAGALAGLLLASWASRALVSQLSMLDVQLSFNLALDWRVLGFTAAISIATAVLFGTSPAIHATRARPVLALRGQTGAGEPGANSARLMNGLIVLQIALSLVLVVGASLFLRTFERLLRVPLGFDSDRILIASVDTSRTRTPASDRLGFYQQIADAIERAPGVARAAVSTVTPLSKATQAPVVVQSPHVQLAVGPGWFATYGTPLATGRDFDARDAANGQPVAIVNEAFARKFLPGRSAVGEVVDGRTLIGIVGDAVFGTVRGGVRPALYVPLLQSAGSGPPGRTEVQVSVRSASVAPALLGRSVAAALTSLDPNLVFTFRPLQEYVDASIAQERTIAGLSGLFGMLALLLAGLGLYGVTSYGVNRRQLEIGIRVALGAQRTHVLGLVLRQTVIITSAGLALGLATAAAATRWIEGMLFGVAAVDPVTYLSVALMLAVIAIAASMIPARRAARIDPMITLRMG